MCCNLLFLVLFTHMNHKSDITYNQLLDDSGDEENTTTSQVSPTTATSNSVTSAKKKSLLPPMISQVWKVPPLSKPERRPWRDIKVGRQIPVATYGLILEHLHQARFISTNILSVVHVGVGHGSLLVACIKVS